MNHAKKFFDENIRIMSESDARFFQFLERQAAEFQALCDAHQAKIMAESQEMMRLDGYFDDE
jgi:hypothetical protein